MKAPLFICYPKCTTCKKAQKWLDENSVDVTTRDIAKENPSEDELRAWHKASGLPLKKFFNTSGKKYKELGLKDKLPAMSEDEQYKLLATDGLLVKRPILVDGQSVLVGFKEADCRNAFAADSRRLRAQNSLQHRKKRRRKKPLRQRFPSEHSR